MASILTLVADAVKDELNAQLVGWGFPGITATRKNTAKFTLETCATLQVTVLPIVAPVVILDRTKLRWDSVVDVDIRKLTSDTDTDEQDDMVELAESIASHFLQSFAHANFKIMTAEPSVTVPSEQMQEAGLFAVAVRLTLMATSSGETV
jgi:hypothetical protein